MIIFSYNKVIFVYIRNVQILLLSLRKQFSRNEQTNFLRFAVDVCRDFVTSYKNPCTTCLSFVFVLFYMCIDVYTGYMLAGRTAVNGRHLSKV